MAILKCFYSVYNMYNGKPIPVAVFEDTSIRQFIEEYFSYEDNVIAELIAQNRLDDNCGNISNAQLTKYQEELINQFLSIAEDLEDAADYNEEEKFSILGYKVYFKPIEKFPF